MRATFVGGPRHGQSEEMKATPDRIWVESSDGSKFLYSIKSEDQEAVGEQPLATTHVWYAEANIDDSEFYRIRETIPIQDID